MPLWKSSNFDPFQNQNHLTDGTKLDTCPFVATINGNGNGKFLAQNNEMKNNKWSDARWGELKKSEFGKFKVSPKADKHASLSSDTEKGAP